MLKNFSIYFKTQKWDEVSASNEPNISLNIFMDTFRYYCTIVFPLKATYVKKSIVNKWITKGIIVSRIKLRLIYNIRRYMNLPMKSVKYIQNYQLIYRKVVKEAKRREADRLVLSAKNKNKAIWKIIIRKLIIPITCLILQQILEAKSYRQIQYLFY